MALFVNDSDHHVTIPDGREGALIVPAGCEAVPGPDGVLVARPHVADGGPVGATLISNGPDGPELFIPAGSDGTGTELPPFDPAGPGPFEAPAAEDAPADDADAPADEAPEATPKRRRGGSAA